MEISKLSDIYSLTTYNQRRRNVLSSYLEICMHKENFSVVSSHIFIENNLFGASWDGALLYLHLFEFAP